MTSKFISGKTRFTIDGIDVTNMLDVTVDDQRKEFEDFDVLDDHYGRHVGLDNYVSSGSVRIKSIHNPYASDPMGIADFFSTAIGYAQYDTTNEVVTMVFDDRDQTTSGQMGPKRIIEIRQTEATASQKIDNEGGDSEAWAQSFIAAGEDIYAIKLKCYTTAAGPLESFQMEIWSDDGAGKPDAIVASTNTVTVYCSAGVDTETDDYIGALTNGVTYADATWETIDMSLSLPDIMDGEDLVVGTTYWLVIKETATTTDDLFLCYTTNDNYGDGKCLRDDDVDVAPAWGDAAAGAKDLTFVVQFEAAEGHEIKIYDYKDSTTGHWTRYDGVRFTKPQVKPQSKMAQEASLNWTAQSVSGPTAF